MGISKAAVHYMLKEAKQRPFAGRALTLGVQQTTISHQELVQLAEKVGYALTDLGETDIPKLDRHQHLTDLYLLKSLGFEEVLRMDYSDFQGADFTFDMNQAETPEAYLSYFDLIIDGGTIEHVFHLPNCLMHIFKLLKEGGRAIHISPSSNHIDHGFYMFSPSLYWDYYTANAFVIHSLKFFEYNRWGNTQKWIAADYQPGCLRYVSGGGLPRAQYGIALTVEKTENSNHDVIPQMHRYSQTWKRKKKRKKSNSMLVYRAKKRIEQLWKRHRVRNFPLRGVERL